MIIIKSELLPLRRCTRNVTERESNTTNKTPTNLAAKVTLTSLLFEGKNCLDIATTIVSADARLIVSTGNWTGQTAV